MFLVVTALCIWLGYTVHRANTQRRAVETIVQKMRGPSAIRYDYEMAEDFILEKERLWALANSEGITPDFHSDSWLPRWCRDWLGKEYFQEVAFVQWTIEEVNDENFEAVSGLDHLEVLVIAGARITDGGIAHIKHLPRLRELSVISCDATESRLSELAKIENLESLIIRRTRMSDSEWERLLSVADRNGVQVTKYKKH